MVQSSSLAREVTSPRIASFGRKETPGLGSGGSGAPIRLLVLGGRGVGKSAVTVRYLTRRFIGEYRSQVDIVYTHKMAAIRREIEIVDLSTFSGDTTLPTLEIRQSDCFLVVYSVAEWDSFAVAKKLVRVVLKLTAGRRQTPPITLLGNKRDLTHSRKVYPEDGEKFSRLLSCRFAEVSAAEGYEGVAMVFRDLLQDTEAVDFSTRHKSDVREMRSPTRRSSSQSRDLVGGNPSSLSSEAEMSAYRTAKDRPCDTSKDSSCQIPAQHPSWRPSMPNSGIASSSDGKTAHAVLGPPLSPKRKNAFSANERLGVSPGEPVLSAKPRRPVQPQGSFRSLSKLAPCVPREARTSAENSNLPSFFRRGRSFMERSLSPVESGSPGLSAPFHPFRSSSNRTERIAVPPNYCADLGDDSSAVEEPKGTPRSQDALGLRKVSTPSAVANIYNSGGPRMLLSFGENAENHLGIQAEARSPLAVEKQKKFSGFGKALGSLLSMRSVPDLPKAGANLSDKIDNLKKSLKKRSV